MILLAHRALIRYDSVTRGSTHRRVYNMKRLIRSLVLFVGMLSCWQFAPGTVTTGCYDSPALTQAPLQTPTFPVVADFNRDGIPDIAVANVSTHTVTVYLGNDEGNGYYLLHAPGSPFDVGIDPSKMVVADYNRDGYPDIAVACPNSGSVEILFNDRQGSFKTPTAKYATGASVTQIATADFNGDGRADLAAVNPTTNDVRIFLGVSGGGFTYAPGVKLTTAGAGARGIAVGDFNGDRHTDFAVANFNTNNVEVFLGDGAGHFTSAPGSPFATGAGPNGMVAGDFNRDGKIDLVTANQTGKSFSFLAGNGAGGFAATTIPIPSGVAPQYLATADLNGDGFLDLLSTNYGTNNASVFFGNGAGGFSEAPFSPLATGANPTGAAIADLTRDGRLDIVIANQGSNTLSTFLKTCPNELDSFHTGASYYATMKAGQSYQVRISMKNTGARAWTYANRDRLGSRSPRDNFTWGNFNRVLLPKGASVLPGQTYDFNFTVTAPSTPGQYHFQWQMVEEQVCWFGPMTDDVVVAVQ